MFEVALAARPMKLALLQLYSEEQAPTSAPYSIEVLAGHVRTRARGWQVSLDVLDNRSLGGASAYAAKLVEMQPDVVGISVAQGTHTLALQLLDEIHAVTNAAQGTPQLVLGNSLPTYRPQPYLERYPNLLIVRGFGEEALLRILARVQSDDGAAPAARPERFRDISSLTLSVAGQVVSSPIEWPKHYETPAWVDPERYFARVEASRGCHYDACTFCTRPPREANAARWVRYPIPKIAATVAKLKALGVERFTFCDEDFIGDDPDGCHELADRLESIGGAPSFSFSTRADNVVRVGDSDAANLARRRLFERLKQVGLSLVFVGAESFCNAQLKRYAKSSSAAGNIRAIETLHSIGLAVEAGMIMFDPFMTPADLQENIDNLRRHELWKFMSQTLSKIDVQEATPLKRWLERRGMLGEYDENQMTYDYRFRDPLIARIVQICDEWRRQTDYAYRLVRNAQRMALFESFPNDIMLAAKGLNFRFLEAVTQALRFAPATLAGVIDNMAVERGEVMRMMLTTKESPRVHVAMGERLSQEIGGFLGAMT